MEYISVCMCVFSHRHDPKSKCRKRIYDGFEYIKRLHSLNMAKGPWNFSWLNSIPRRWRTNKEVSNSWLLQSSWLPGCKTYVVKFLKTSTLCAPCHRDKHFAKRHAAFTPHSRIIHSRPHYGGTHLILEKKNLFSFVLAVFNVQFCPIMG